MRLGTEEAGQHRSVADRLILIVETVSRQRRAVGLTRLASLTGIAKPTVHRLATELVRHRLLEHDDAGYTLGFHLFELGQQVPTSRRLRDVALPLMSDLLAATHEIVQLGVLDGAEIVYIEKLTGPRSAEAPSKVGSRLPAYQSALGKAILAFSDADAVDHVLQSPMPASTSATITTPPRFLRELASVRDQGVAYDRGEGVAGIVCIGAPILDSTGRAAAAISVTGPSHRLRPQQISYAVRTAALSISRTMNARVLLDA